MAKNDVRTIAYAASEKTLQSSVVVYGEEEYTIATNYVSWSGDKLYTMEEISKTFGLRASAQAIGEDALRIQAGKSTVSVFDFGLLYTVFSSIIMASVELGAEVPTEDLPTNNELYRSVWFGNDGIIYSVQKGLIVSIRNSDMYSCCMHQKANIRAFTSNQEFQLSLDGTTFCLTSGNSIVCRFRPPVCITQTYRTVFDGEQIADDPSTPWDETSMLGSLIADTDERTDVFSAVEKYAQKTSMAQAVYRDDLICEPTKRFADVNSFLGSWAYSDKKEIIMPVSNRNNLLVCTGSQSVVSRNKPELKCYVDPDYSKFYDITEEFTHIMRFALCVKNLPLTAAELDTSMFLRIKEAFLSLELQRVKLTSSFGRIVIPEDVMIRELSSSIGDALYCIVPVGVIGEQIILMNSFGQPITQVMTEWDVEGFFYDVTDVVNAHV